jgi:hypothetical protein
LANIGQFLNVESLPEMDQAEMMYSPNKNTKQMMSQMVATSSG